MGALTDRLESMSEKLKTVTTKIDEGVAAVKDAANAEKAKLQAKLDEAKKSAADAKSAAEAKANDAAGKIQASIADAKAKVEAKKDQKDKENWEAYIAGLLDYAELCQNLAVQLAAESQAALLTAAAENAEFNAKYGA